MSDIKVNLIKLVLKNGQTLGAFAETFITDELMAHPKFLKFTDNFNDIYISIEDIVAFENMDTRRPEQPPAPPPQNAQENPPQAG